MALTLKIWDSPDADLTDDVELARITFKRTKTCIVKFPEVGVYAHKGIYVEVIADPKATVKCVVVYR